MGALAVVRRKIGFEFETPWTLKAPGNLIGSDSPAVQGHLRDADDEPIKAWHISPDMKAPVGPDGKVLPEFQESTKTVPHSHLGFLGMTETAKVLPKYTGFGNLEFITKPFEEDDAGLELMRQTIVGIVKFARQFYRFYPGEIPLTGELSRNVVWGKHVKDKPTNKDIVVDTKPTDNSTDKKRLRASIQMTGGIKLEQIPRLIQVLSKNEGAGATLLHRGPDSFTPLYDASLKAARTLLVDGPDPYFATLADQQRGVYLGAVAHLVSIIKFGAVMQDLEQAKYSSPLLSRTDFGKFPDYVLKPVLVDHVATAAGVVKTAKLFALSDKIYDGTVGAWLAAIVAGSDPVNWGQDKSDKRWKPQEVGGQGDRSIGHVYEFRALQGHLYLDDWLTTAMYLFDVVRRINRT